MMDAEMYGMMPRAKIVSRARLPPENRSHQAEQAPPLLGEELLERRRVDAGGRDPRADAVDREQGERESDPLAQVGDVGDVLEGFDHSSQTRSALSPCGFDLCGAPRPCHPVRANVSAAVPRTHRTVRTFGPRRSAGLHERAAARCRSRSPQPTAPASNRSPSVSTFTGS